MEARHSIKAVAQKTGLSPFIIRAWERRYQAVTPARTDTNRRLYSESDINRLNLLSQVILGGEKISHIAGLTNDQLQQYISVDNLQNNHRESLSLKSSTAPQFLNECIKAVRDLNYGDLESILMKASVSLSLPVLLQHVVSPLLETVGNMWQDGTIRVANEHQASAVIRTFLGMILNAQQQRLSSKIIISCTPSGQTHELGALLVAISAASCGWKSIYIAGNMPAEDIANAVMANQASALAMSIIYPADDPFLGSELLRIRELIGSKTSIIIGGRAASSYAGFIQNIEAMIVGNLNDLRNQLDLIKPMSSKS